MPSLAHPPRAVRSWGRRNTSTQSSEQIQTADYKSEAEVLDSRHSNGNTQPRIFHRTLALVVTNRDGLTSQPRLLGPTSVEFSKLQKGSRGHSQYNRATRVQLIGPDKSK